MAKWWPWILRVACWTLQCPWISCPVFISRVIRTATPLFMANCTASERLIPCSEEPSVMLVRKTWNARRHMASWHNFLISLIGEKSRFKPDIILSSIILPLSWSWKKPFFAIYHASTHFMNSSQFNNTVLLMSADILYGSSFCLFYTFFPCAGKWQNYLLLCNVYFFQAILMC